MSDAQGVDTAVLAERINGLAGKVSEFVQEQQRMRARLHNLEGFAAAYLDVQRENRRVEARQYRRLELRLQVLTVVIALAAVVVPVIVAVLTGR